MSITAPGWPLPPTPSSTPEATRSSSWPKATAILSPARSSSASRARIYEVLGGLSDGENVVTSANFLVDSESSLKAALNRMTKAAAGEK